MLTSPRIGIIGKTYDGALSLLSFCSVEQRPSSFDEALPMLTDLEIAIDYYREEELAEKIGKLRGEPISVQGLRLWRRQGKGPPATKIGRATLYRVAAVKEWLQGLEERE
jgi:hypothetical protein